MLSLSQLPRRYSQNFIRDWNSSVERRDWNHTQPDPCCMVQRRFLLKLLCCLHCHATEECLTFCFRVYLAAEWRHMLQNWWLFLFPFYRHWLLLNLFQALMNASHWRRLSCSELYDSLLFTTSFDIKRNFEKWLHPWHLKYFLNDHVCYSKEMIPGNVAGQCNIVTIFLFAMK
jgi:hypothetical protein